MAYLGYSFLALYALWLFYLVVMGLKRVNDTVGLPGPAKVFGYPTLIIGVAWDWFCNWTVVSLLYLELPASLGELVTGRLKRHKADANWRGDMTRWLAAGLLDDFDPTGRHV